LVKQKKNEISKKGKEQNKNFGHVKVDCLWPSMYKHQQLNKKKEPLTQDNK